MKSKKQKELSKALKQVGYKKIKIEYKKDKVIINGDHYHASSIDDVSCDIDYFYSFNELIATDYDYLTGFNISLATNDEMGYLLGYFEEEEIDITICSVKLVILTSDGLEHEYLLGVFLEDDDNLFVCENKGYDYVDKITDFCDDCID